MSALDPPEGDPSVEEDEDYVQAVMEGGPDDRIGERDLTPLDLDPRESLDDPHHGGGQMGLVYSGQSMWTVIGYYDGTKQAFAEQVLAVDGQGAFAATAHRLADEPDAVLVAAVPDHQAVSVPCEETGRTCFASDYPQMVGQGL